MHIPNVLQQNTRHVPGQGQEAVEGRNTAVRLRGVSNHPVHHCCDKHPRTWAGVTTCPAQLITNQDVLQTSQMATPKVNQNVTFKTPEFKKKKNQPKPEKSSTLQSEGKDKWSVYKIPSSLWVESSSSGTWFTPELAAAEPM